MFYIYLKHFWLNLCKFSSHIQTRFRSMIFYFIVFRFHLLTSWSQPNSEYMHLITVLGQVVSICSSIYIRYKVRQTEIVYAWFKIWKISRDLVTCSNDIKVIFRILPYCAELFLARNICYCTQRASGYKF